MSALAPYEKGADKATSYFRQLNIGFGIRDLSNRLELPVEVLDPFRNIKIDTKKFDAEYLSEIVPEMAVAVGLAMRGV